MHTLRLGPWYRHDDVALRQAEGQTWLVGRGLWQEADVFAHKPLGLATPWEQAHPDAHSANWDDKLDRLQGRLMHSLVFASIRTPEQALVFARHYGLLGVRITTPLEMLSSLPSSQARFLKAYPRAKRTASISLRALAGGKLASLWPPPPEARAALARRLLLSEEEVDAVLPVLAASPIVLLPEPMDEWLQWAAFTRKWLAVPDEAQREWPRPRSILEQTRIAGLLGGTIPLDVSSDPPRVRFRTLLEGLFTELRLSQPPRRPIECPAPGCGRWLIPSKSGGHFCCRRCKKRYENWVGYDQRLQRAGKARRYRTPAPLDRQPDGESSSQPPELRRAPLFVPQGR